MDFYVLTPTGAKLIMQLVDGKVIVIPPEPPTAAAPLGPNPGPNEGNSGVETGNLRGASHR